MNGVEAFWVSRKQQELRPKPEQIAQLSLLMFLDEPIRDRSGFTLKEVHTGIGYVDVMAVFGRSKRYIVELKIRTGPRFNGSAQLKSYLASHRLTHGWLVLFDSRTGPKELAGETLVVDGRTIDVVSVDINPVPPSTIGRRISPAAARWRPANGAKADRKTAKSDQLPIAAANTVPIA
jgi:hypothetical protein